MSGVKSSSSQDQRQNKLPSPGIPTQATRDSTATTLLWAGKTIRNESSCASIHSTQKTLVRHSTEASSEMSRLKLSMNTLKVVSELSKETKKLLRSAVMTRPVKLKSSTEHLGEMDQINQSELFPQLFLIIFHLAISRSKPWQLMLVQESSLLEAMEMLTATGQAQ